MNGTETGNEREASCNTRGKTWKKGPIRPFPKEGDSSKSDQYGFRAGTSEQYDKMSLKPENDTNSTACTQSRKNDTNSTECTQSRSEKESQNGNHVPGEKDTNMITNNNDMQESVNNEEEDSHMSKEVKFKETNKTVLNYKSELNKTKYKFPHKDKSEEELNMWIDKRNIFEVFRDMLNKINDKIPPAQVESLSKMAKYDLRVPMVSENGIPLLKADILELVKIWKKNEKLSEKTKQTITEIEKAGKQLKETCLPEEVRKGGFSLENRPTLPSKQTKKISNLSKNCECCLTVKNCPDPTHCVYKTCLGECFNISYEDCHLDKCHGIQRKNEEDKEEEEEEDDESTQINEAKEKDDLSIGDKTQMLKQEFFKLLIERKDKPLTAELLELINKLEKETLTKRMRNTIRRKMHKLRRNQIKKNKEETKVMYINLSESENLPYLEAHLSYDNKTTETKVILLADSGAEINLLKEEDAQGILQKAKITPVDNICLSTANGSSDQQLVYGKIIMKVMFGSKYELCCFYLLKKNAPLKHSLLGMPFLRRIRSEIKILDNRTLIRATLLDKNDKYCKIDLECIEKERCNGKDKELGTIEINNSMLTEEELQMDEERNTEEKSRYTDGVREDAFDNNIKCLCPQHNKYIKWCLPEEEIKGFREYLCNGSQSEEINHVAAEEETSPFSTKFSDDPIDPPQENVGEKLLLQRDIMSTIQNVKENQTLEVSHLNDNDRNRLKEILKNHSGVIQTEKNKLGKFKYFEGSFQLDDIAGANQRNRDINMDRAPEAIKKIEELRELGVLETSTSSKTVFNFVLVKKPTGVRLMSKADRYIASMDNQVDVKWRITCDASSINKHIINMPRVILPKKEAIQKKIRNKFLSSIDICDQFFCIPTDPETRKYTNVYFRNEILQWNRTVQGIASSPYIAQSAMNITFAKVIFDEWINKKKLSSQDFPYTSFNDFATWYLDDTLIYSDIKFGSEVHWLAVDAVLYALERAGWICSMKKCQFMTNKIKWLGTDLNANTATAECNLERASAILDMRLPRSTAEASSRASLILYCANFLPFLKKLLLPIHQMVCSGVFKWDRACSEAYNEIKLLISLNIKNQIFDSNREVIIQTDSSKLAIGIVAWQPDDYGKLQLLDTKSSFLTASQMRKQPVERECSAITYALDQFQDYILGCKKTVYLLTDSKPLVALKRSKLTNSRFYEQSILLTSFPNLEVVFLHGKNLAISDILSRSFNDVYIKETNSLSEQMASILPPIPPHLFKKVESLNNEQLTDFILGECPKEFVDIFDNKLYYKQSKNHKSEIERLLSSISPEQEIIYFLRAGWENVNLYNLSTIKELLQKQKKLTKTGLEEVIKRHQLVGMRRMTDNLKMHDEFLKKIKRNFTVEEEEANKTEMTKKLTMVTTRSKAKVNKEDEVIQTKSYPKKKPIRMKCEEHPDEGHKISQDLIMASNSINMIDKLVNAWLALGNISNNIELSNICKEYQSQKCILNKLQTYQKSLSGIARELAEIRSFEVCDENGEVNTIICFYNFFSEYFTVNCSDYSITIVASKEIQMREFESFSIKIFLFIAMNGDYALIQGSSEDIFTDISVQDVNAFFSDTLVLFNLSNKEITIKEGQEVLSINMSQAATKRRVDILFVPVEKETVEANFQKFSWSQENSSKEMLEKALDTYYINFIDKTKIVSEKDETKENAELVKKYLEGLNLFIVSLKLVKKPGTLCKDDIYKMQQSDPILKTLFQKYTGKNDGKYIIQDNILFHRKMDKQGQEFTTLCIPSYLIKMFTNSFHAIGNSHMSAANVSFSLSQLYHHPEMKDICKEAVKNCVTCNLCHKPDKVTISGGDRTFRKNILPGEIFEVDVLFLPLNKQNRYPAAMIVCDVVTNYLSCIPLLKVNSYYTSQAIGMVFKTLGLPRVIKADSGSEWKKTFTSLCASLNITVVTTIPGRSNSISNAERSINQLKNVLVKMVSQYVPTQRRDWMDTALPLALNAINCSIFRKTSLSRKMLMFSPYIFHHGKFLMHCPIRDNLAISALHKRTLISLEKLRSANLLRKKNYKLNEICENMIVIHIADDKNCKTQDDGSKALVPAASNIYKVKEMLSGDMGLTVFSLVDGSERTLSKSEVRPMTLNDTLGLSIDPVYLFQEIKQNRLRTSFKKSKRGMSLPSTLEELEEAGRKEDATYTEEDDTELEDEEDGPSKRITRSNNAKRKDEEELEDPTQAEEVKEINQISINQSILKNKECYYKNCSNRELDVEIHRLKYNEFLNIKSALWVTESEELPLSRIQQTLSPLSFDFTSLKRYNIAPLTDQEKVTKSDKKVTFGATPTYYLIPRQFYLNQVDFQSVAAKALSYEHCISNAELKFLEFSNNENIE